jgi:hypothetical protein
MRLPNQESDSINLNNKFQPTKHDISESSSKSLLANVFDERINDFVLNDDFGVINHHGQHGNTIPRLQAVTYGHHVQQQQQQQQHHNAQNNIFYGNNTTTQTTINNSNSNDFLNQRIPGFNTKAKNINGLKSYINNDIIAVKKEIHQILEEVKQITKKIKEDDDDANKELDWKFAAMVLDKLCLYVFSILTITSTSVILLSSPNFFKLK